MRRRTFIQGAFTASANFLCWQRAFAHQIKIDALVPSRQFPTRPSPRQGHSLVYDEQRRRVILLDGYQKPYQPDYGEVWSWDGKSWTLIPGSGPSGRSLSGVAYDVHRKKIVLYGGVGNKGYEDLRGDTWEWDGRHWREMADTRVGTRDHHVMAYDAARKKTIMYGGIASRRDLPSSQWKRDTDIWEWDGLKWTSIKAQGPGSRAHFALVYDNTRKKIVLFGGITADRRYNNDTWTWDGKVWQKVSDGGPQPRARHRMAFDTKARMILLYGGDGLSASDKPGFNVLADTWVWDGRTWMEIKAPGPGKRFMHAMCYDRARNRTVLYSGSDGSQTFGDTWEWDGREWTPIN